MTNGDFIRSMTDEDITENLTPGICNLIQHRDPERCQTREHCFHCVKDWLKDLSWENLERVKVTIICEAMALVLSGEYEGGKQTDGNVHGNL